MSKASYEGPNSQVLEAAGLFAPIVRSMKADTRERRVTLYKRETGEVTGESTVIRLVLSLAKAKDIEVQTNEETRPTWRNCDKCERPFSVLANSKKPPALCDECRTPPLCAREGCGKRVSRDAMSPSIVARRGGKPPCCSISCSKTPEQRSEMARKASAAMTPEQRSERARKANAALTPEQRSERSRKNNATKTPEQRSEIMRKANAARTPEQRYEAMRKAWEKRRANAAKKAASQ